MIGNKIKGANTTYTITKAIAIDDRPNAHIYLCTDDNGDKFIAKHFYNQAPMANIALGELNHYGRRRDGSDWVFREIHEKNKHYDFLVKHVERIRYNSKWIIILEFIEGEPLSKFIRATYNTDITKVDEAVTNFTKVLVEWHTNSFAHGDPHLDNVMIDPATMKVTLIDYSQIHHPDFYYCQQYGCYSPDPQLRFKHDLDNYTHKLGDGFRNCLTYLDDELKLGTRLADIFDNNYTISLR